MDKTIQSCHGIKYWFSEKKIVQRIAFGLILAMLAIYLYRYHHQRFSEDASSSGVQITALGDVIGADQKLLSRREWNSAADVIKRREKRRATRQRKSKKHQGKKLREFKRIVRQAKSYDAVLRLIGKNVCRSKSSSKQTQPTRRTTPAPTTTVAPFNTTGKALTRNVSVVGTFGDSINTAGVEFRIYGPRNETQDVTEARTRHKSWMASVRKNGICRPMDLILDLEPTKSVEHSGSSATIVNVKRCFPLYNALHGNTTTCHSVESVMKTVSFRGEGSRVRSYDIYDDVECRTTKELNETETRRNREENENSRSVRKKKVKPSKTPPQRCPWPFKFNETSHHCSCRRPKEEGDKGYLVYKACRRIQRGIWKLQKKQIKCVRRGNCLNPECNSTKVYDVEQGRCVDRQEQTLATTSNSRHTDNCTDHETTTARTND